MRHHQASYIYCRWYSVNEKPQDSWSTLREEILLQQRKWRERDTSTAVARSFWARNSLRPHQASYIFCRGNSKSTRFWLLCARRFKRNKNKGKEIHQQQLLGIFLYSLWPHNEIHQHSIRAIEARNRKESTAVSVRTIKARKVRLLLSCVLSFSQSTVGKINTSINTYISTFIFLGWCVFCLPSRPCMMQQKGGRKIFCVAQAVQKVAMLEWFRQLIAAVIILALTVNLHQKQTVK